MKDFKFKLETLKRNLNSLTAKASDIEDQIKYGELSGKKKRKREVENWLEEVHKIEGELDVLQNEVQEEGFFSRFFGENRVAELNTRVCELVEQTRHFGDLLLDAYETRGEPLLTTPLIGDAFERNMEKIWKWLVTDKVPNIGIYGMGGVGKTTLAMHINNRLLKEPQYSVCWLPVSQVFTIYKLQGDIAKFIGLDLSDENNEDKRAGRLNRALSKWKDFVLILDDVWTDISLKDLGDPLDVEGCRLIVTTRSKNVFRRIGCRHTIKVETLEGDESWNLFKETLGQGTIITSEIEEIAKFVAKECDGLPLGIIVLSGSMKGVTDIREWRNVREELKESPMEKDDMEEKVFRVLKYSFNRLDPNYREKSRNGYIELQHCFLYCSLYPEDYLIESTTLIRRFVTEEFVDKRKSWEKQLDQGYTMLKSLVNLCLLETTGSVSEDTVKYVRMHDLVRDMALKIARGIPRFKVFAGLSLKEIPNEEEWTEDVEKMSLMKNDIRKIPPGKAPTCPKLSTLLLNDNPLEFIPETFFVQMSSLRILDLSSTLIKVLPNSLSDLENIDTLLLGSSKIESVPYLGKLKALSELDLSWTSIKVLPNSLSELESLNTLLLEGCEKLVFLPNLGELKALRMLNLSRTSIKKLPYSLSYLENLNSLLLGNCKKLVFVPDLGKLKALSELDLSRTSIKELPISLSELESLNTLLLGGCEKLVFVPYLGKLKALRKLDLSRTSIKRIPKGMKNLINLEILLLRGMKDLMLLPGDLSLTSPYLQHLRLPYQFEAPVREIVKMKHLKEFVGSFKHVSDFNWFIKSQTAGLIPTFFYNVGNSFYEEEEGYTINRKTVSVYKCSFRREEGEDGVIILPENIQKLKIVNCEGLSRCLLDDFKSLTSLEELKISSCDGIQSILNINDQFMTEEEANSRCFPFKNLQNIFLSNLLNFNGVINCEVGAVQARPSPPQPAMVFSFLRRLNFFKCNKMKMLGLPLPYLQNIEYIGVVHCDEIEEMIQVEDDQERSGFLVYLPNLNSLSLRNLPKLKSICKARMNCNSIETVELVCCPQVKKLPLFLPPSCNTSLDEQLIHSPPPALRRIDIQKELWESLEWEDPTHKDLLQCFVHYY